MMMMSIAANSIPPASERVTGRFEFNSKNDSIGGAIAGHSFFAASVFLLVLRGAKIEMDSMMLTMAERAEGVPVGNSPSATISWSVPRACP